MQVLIFLPILVSPSVEKPLIIQMGDGLLNSPEQNILTRYLDTWSLDNPNAQFPRAVLEGGANINRNGRRSSALVYDTSYLRLQSLQLRYSLPQAVTTKLGLSRVSISATGTNLFTVTEYPGIDPTSFGGFAGIGSVETRDPYPISKTWSLGLNINF